MGRMPNLHIAWIIAAIVITLTSRADPSAAAAIYPWCANYGGRGFGMLTMLAMMDNSAQLFADLGQAAFETAVSASWC